VQNKLRQITLGRAKLEHMDAIAEAKREAANRPPTPPPLSEEEAARRAELPGLLRTAAKEGNIEQIEALLAEGAAVDDVDEKGYTALYNATMYQQQEAVSLLLGAGAEVDKENNNGVTPLMAAARDGYSLIVKQLLEAGANVEQVDEFGRTVSYTSNVCLACTLYWHLWM
jgi:ankyrin repeat protein